jgi:uncharacterized membrane protein YczE
MDLIIIGIAVAFNLIIVLRKAQAGQYLNALVDGTLLGLVAVFFSVSTAALIIGTIGSLLVSIYLSFFPVGGRRGAA